MFLTRPSVLITQSSFAQQSHAFGKFLLVKSLQLLRAWQVAVKDHLIVQAERPPQTIGRCSGIEARHRAAEAGNNLEQAARALTEEQSQTHGTGEFEKRLYPKRLSINGGDRMQQLELQRADHWQIDHWQRGCAGSACGQGISEDVGLSLAEVQTFEFPGQLRQLPQSLVHRVRVRFSQSIEQSIAAIERI